MSTLNTYTSLFPNSQALYKRACEVFPSGATHDSRFFNPFPIYIAKASGSRKWDVDGNEYIDYWNGHGALLLGHNRPEVVSAVQEQLLRGTHYGAPHELEVEWGELVKKLVPSAEEVRFVNSGTEATIMAIRLARTFTGKDKIVKFEGHFHGWHDAVIPGVKPPFDVPASPGIPKSVLDKTIVCPANDIERLEQIFNEDDDIAGVIIEPTGGSFIALPIRDGFLKELRDLTNRYGILLIFDEVVTGFRCAPGGAQEFFGVKPDLTALAKILAGGLPGGAVVGRKDIMDYLSFKDDKNWNRYKKIYHPGTFNANPLSASAGIATLKIVSSGDDIEKANRMAKYLRDEMNRVIDRHSINWCVYGQFSGFRVLTDYEGDRYPGFEQDMWKYDPVKLKIDPTTPLEKGFRMGMLINGVDIMPSFATVSSAHSEEDIDKTISAFDKTITMLKKEKLIA